VLSTALDGLEQSQVVAMVLLLSVLLYGPLRLRPAQSRRAGGAADIPLPM